MDKNSNTKADFQQSGIQEAAIQLFQILEETEASSGNRFPRTIVGITVKSACLSLDIIAEKIGAVMCISLSRDSVF